MKPFAFLLFCAVTLLSGCESVSSRVHDRFSAVPPQTRIFAADRRAVYTAGQVAVKNVGLLLGRTSLAQGLIEAYAPIRQGDALRDTRQTTLQIHLTETDGGDTEVALLVSESTEGNFPGGVSEQGLRVHSLYEMYFTALQQVLVENGSIKAAVKP
jgi:hypothetical protein